MTRRRTSQSRSQNGGLLIVAILVIALAAPYFLGAYVAVHFLGAGVTSTTRTLVAWLFELPWLIALGFFAVRAWRKHVAYKAAVAEYNAPRAVAGPGGSTVYHHGACVINHKTADSAAKCRKG